MIAEQVGFDSVWVSDHFQPWRHQDGHAPVFDGVAGRSGRANRTCNHGHQRRHSDVQIPSVRGCQAMATLTALSPERVILGVGTGESINEVPATGMVWPKFKERFDRLQESIDLMRQLWTKERVTYNGHYYQTRNATVYDRPAQPIPVYVAAAGPTASRLAGETGDGFICTSGKAPELYREVLLPNVQQGIEKSGRNFGELEKMIEMKVSFDPDLDCARNDTLHWAALALSPEEKTGIDDPVEMENRANALSVERAASRWLVASHVEEHIEQIKPYVELGFTHLVFHAPGPDQEKFLRLYAEVVLPRLRSEFD